LRTGSGVGSRRLIHTAHAKWTLEIYEKSGYSEGLETGRQFISLEKELLAREAELRRLQALYKYLRAVPREFLFPEVTKL